MQGESRDGMARRMPSAPYTRLKSDWREVLKSLLEERRLTMRAASIEAGLNHAAISEWLREGGSGKQKQPSFDSIAAVAHVLGVSLDVFTETTSPPENPADPGLAPARLQHAEVVGIIQAGVWRESDMVETFENAFIPYIPHPLYDGLRQYAWRVSGPSMNRIARDGEFIIGVRIIELGHRPPDNSPVVCERRRGGLYEHTVKRIRYMPEGPQLIPDSEDPRFQEPAWTPSHADDGEEVEATHLVIGVYRPI